MTSRILKLIDFAKVDTLLEGFNKTTGFVTAILDLDGNVLSKSGWQQICTAFHRIHPETAKRCLISDTELANKMAEGEKYHFYQCLNGLVDVAVPIVIKGEHIANLFSGQFFFEEPDNTFFQKQADQFGFNRDIYLKALGKVPVISEEKVKVAMDFLQNMTQIISEMTFQKLEQIELNEAIQKSESRFRSIFENSLAVMLLIDPATHQIVDANYAAERFYGWSRSLLSLMTIGQINTLPSEELQAEMETARSQKRVYFKFKHRLADGSVRDVEVYSSKVEIDGKDYLHSVIHDITEQIKAENAILKNEQILRLFVEHSPASIAMFDSNMRYLVASHRFLADYDLGEQNLIGRSHYDVFPEISERWKEFHRRSLAGETLKNSNDPFPRTDGKTDWVRWEIRPWYESQNLIGGIILFSEVITAQIEDREALKESEKYNRMLFEQSAIGLAVTSLDGKLVDINLTFANIIGRTIEETKSLTYWDITPISYWEQEQQLMESLAITGNYGPCEKEYIHKDGHLVPVRLQGLYIERNNEKLIWSSVEDITEQKLAESKLLANNQLLTNTLESMSDAFVSLDRNWCYTYMNEKAGAIFGRDPKEMIGKNIWTEFPEGVGQPFQLNYEKAMNEKVFIQMEEYYPPYDRWFENRINPTDDGIAIFFQDITERKLAEEKLKQSETQYRNLIEQAADGILLADTNGNIRKVNSAFCAMLGYTEEELLKLNLSETYLPEEREMMSRRLSGIGKSYSIRFERNLVRKDKSIIPVESIIARTSHGLYQGIVRDISERKQAEILLTESERKYRYLFENNPAPMWIYDLETLRFLEVNDTAIIQYGYSREEFLSMTLKNIRPEEDINSLLKDVEQTVTPFNKAGIWRHIKKNGNIIFVEITSHQIEFDKRPARMVIINDISERKKIEESLVESENSLKQAQIIANMGDWEFDLIANKSKWSENSYRLYGLEPFEIIPTYDYFRSRVHPDDLHLIDEGFTTILHTKSPIGLEIRITLPDNKIKWILNKIIPTFNDNELVFLKGVNIDITEKKEAEKQLRLLSISIEQSPVSMVITDVNGTIEYINPSFTKTTGYTKEEAMGKNPRVLKSGIHDTSFYEEMWKTLLSGQSWIGEVQNRKKNGDLYWENAIISPILNTNGEIIHFVAAKEDITEKKTLYSDLIKEKEHAEESDRLKSAFLANMSHEIRTPLNSIIGFSELLADPDFEKEQKNEFIQLIISNGNNLLTIISDIMDISRLETGEVNIYKNHLYAQKFLSKVKGLFAMQVESKQLELIVLNYVFDNEVEFVADADRLMQVFNNLINNALKFTTIGSIEIGYQMNDQMLEFYVRDTGIGIPPEFHDRIFDRFRQVEGSFTRKYGGNGLGLSISKNLIELMGGKIRVESEVGKGSTFYFTLPRITEETK